MAMEPDIIVLPDGRVYRVSELVRRATRPKNYNLRRTRTVPVDSRVPRALAGEESARRTVKYTLEERIWQASATIPGMQARYQITEKQAITMKYQSRYILDQLDIPYK